MRRLAGMQRIIGFAASMALLAIASLMAIPVMMRASGAQAWGAVALGQAVGGFGAVLVTYGWNMAGPAQIAGASPSEARRQFVDSVAARSFLSLPVAVTVAAISWLSAISPYGALAAVGALSSMLVGMSANWYFVGTVQPWALLATETVPRVLGTAAGIAFMMAGHSAMAGVLGQLAGMALAVAVSTFWVLRSLANQGAQDLPRSPVLTVLKQQRGGVLASAASSAISALPVVVVTHANPAAQPMFAFVDKLQRQIMVALTPFVTVLQGWVPRGDRRARGARAMALGPALGIVLTLAILAIAPLLTRLLGGGVVHTGWALNLAMATYVGLGTYELLLSHVVLSTFNRLTFVASVTTGTGVLTLLALAPAAIRWGALGAMLALLLGLLLRAAAEAAVGAAAIRHFPRRALTEPATQ